MKNIKYYAFPSSVKEALAVLLNKKYKAMALAGGTLVAKTLPDTVETYLDLKNLPIKSIRLHGGNLVIGAGATFDDIDRSKLCRGWAGGVISAAAARCSSQLIRNMATIGGNIARPHSFNIFPVVLLGLDAKVRLQAKKGARLVDFQDLYTSGLGLRPGLDSLITEIVVPARTKKWKCDFIKLAKTASSWESYITLFFSAEKKGRSATQARVVVGALSPRPFRAPEAEKAMLSGAGGQAAARALAAELEAARAGEYRSSAASSLFKRFIEGQI
ncbi:MAG: FAD binding domain-containing protein [Elusimicrobiota bacterium]|nr:FAD binding domain-containing protein [Elusimicrobiota bacterium]